MQRCIRCRADYHTRVNTCTHCGWKFGGVTEEELPAWFDEVQAVLEAAYTQAKTPWQQSGKGGTYKDWERGRRPIAEAIQAPGTFLDVGCANGYLLECLMQWAEHAITPYGLEVSEPLLALARERLPAHAGHLYHGNGLFWQPPHRFDYVRTELVYVPLNWQKHYLRRLLGEVTAPGGKLLVVEYTSRRDPHPGAWADELITGWGLPIEATYHGFAANGTEITRVAVVPA